MEMNSINLLGNSSIGIFGFSTNSYALFPYNIKEHTKEIIRETLNVELINTSINNSHLIGLFTSGNSNHLLLPSLVSDLEYNEIDSNLADDVVINILDSKLTALGNVIVANDDVAIISPEFTKEEQSKISDYLDVEVETRQILNSSIVGSMVFTTTKGLLAHPLISDDELSWLESYFMTKSDVVTVNRGTPYPRPGIIGNKNGILVGSDTTGPELMRIFEILS